MGRVTTHGAFRTAGTGSWSQRLGVEAYLFLEALLALRRHLEIERLGRRPIEIHEYGDDEKDADEENDHVHRGVISKKI